MKNNNFVILVTVYNAASYIKQCLDSILSQDYKNYIVTVMDDCSTDGTSEIIEKYPFFHLRNDPKRPYPFSNFITGIKQSSFDPEDIITLVSGDDWLAGNVVLSYLNEVYQNDILMTYGQFVPASGNYGPYCKPIPDIRTYRKSGEWLASHLVTCKNRLWNQIKDKDLRYKNGEYPTASADRAFMYPMIEMAGAKHIQFIEKILYIYNDLNPLCVYKTNPEESIKQSMYYMNKPSYKEL